MRIFCLLCIWYGAVYFFMKCILLISWDGWMACTVCSVKPCLFLPQREVYLLCVPFEQLVQHVFWNRGISLHIKTSCSSLYSKLYNTFFFLEVVSEPRPAAYTMYNNLNWISFKRTDDRDTIYDGCNMIKGTHWSLIFKLR